MQQLLGTVFTLLVLLGGPLVAAEALGAFHGGGVGSCGGCHLLHLTDSGGPLAGPSVVGLLRASDPSSLCLTCHAGPGAPAGPSVFSFDGSALTPGGDFYWNTRTFSWLGGSSPAAGHGHSIVAVDFNLAADPRRSQSPGGTYPAARLSCISCHDPHGKSRAGVAGSNGAISGSGSYGAEPAAATRSGNYRMLGGAGYLRNGFTFAFDAPVARQNPALPFAESDTSHVDYGAGMSEWCANCHGELLGNNHQTAAGFRHPSGAGAVLSAAVSGTYNSYVQSGELSGSAASAYLQFVPFERGLSDAALLDPGGTGGPGASAQVMCLSCHRAHATAFAYGGRWDLTAVLLSESHPAPGDAGAGPNDLQNRYYGRDIGAEFGSGQGPFCEKCHGSSPP